MKQAIIIGFLGKTQDRFSEYNQPLDTVQKLQLLSEIEGMDGAEIVYPYEVSSPEQTKAMLDGLGLKFAAINVNIKKEPEWVAGALTRPERAIRERAVDMIRKAKDFAKSVGAPHVTCCTLNDGYDLLFQVDYKKAWNSMIEAVGEAADYLPEIPLFLEPKYSETRVHCQLDSTSKALLLLKEVGNPHTGVTLDFGHSLQSAENPAQALATIYETGFDAYVHTNDNDCRADWDLLGGSRHFLHYVEFMYYAQQYGYDKYFTTDASPRIFKTVDFFKRHCEITTGVYNLAASLDRKALDDMMAAEDYNGLMKYVNRMIYRV